MLPSGETVEEHTLSNGSGASATILTYGGIVTSLRVPDRARRLADVVLGFDNLEAYVCGRAYHGAIVGRIAGRVSAGRLLVDGRVHALPLNDGANHLHGGHRGLDRRVWSADPAGAASLRLTYLSPDGEEGYPGNVTLTATYTLTDANALVFEIEAATDTVTAVSPTQHCYFNLAGEGSGSVLGHELRVHGGAHVPADGSLTLCDRIEPVDGSGADLRAARPLAGALPRLFKAHGDLYVLRQPGSAAPHGPTLAARLHEPASGRVLEVLTDEPCLQLYTGVALDGSQKGKSGTPYGPHAGLCLECQGYPNAGRLDGLGGIILRPGSPRRRRTIYAFSTDNLPAKHTPS
jgi:aldose 1-epimerase